MSTDRQESIDVTADLETADVGGRPAKLTAEVEERILAAIRTHQRIEVAAGLVGVGRSTLYGWLGVGARAKERLGKGAERSDLTAHESRCADFVDAVSEAMAMAEATAVHAVRVAGTRPSVETKTTRRCVGMEDGEPVFAIETTTTERPPDARAAQWWLERRVPAYRSRTGLEVTGAEGRPIEVEFAARMAALDARIKRGSAAIAADSREVDE